MNTNTPKTKLPAFTKIRMESAKGRQKSQYDIYLDDLKEPGDALQFPTTEISRATASNISRRMNLLTNSNEFHSFFDAPSKCYIIRHRMPGEAADESTEEESEEVTEEVKEVVEAAAPFPEGDDKYTF